MRGFMRIALAVAWLACFALAAQSSAQAQPEPLVPNTDYTPDQVIGIVIDALKHNRSESGDAGIATVYRFASPANRTATGPLARFTAMIKHAYSDMLNHRSSRRSPVEIRNNAALQAVWLTSKEGIEVGYVFRLGLQQSGEYAGMWMTEAVYPLGETEREQAI